MKKHKAIFTQLLKNTLAAMLLMSVTSMSQAVTFNFTEIVNDGGPDLSEQLSVDVVDLGSNNVGFTFFNGRDGEITVDSNIAGIFFDVGSSNVMDIVYSSTDSSDGVLFTSVNGTPNLPEGELLDPEFTDDSGFKFGHDSDYKGHDGGVDDANGGTAEFASFIASFGGSFLFSDLLANIYSRDFRLGLHVISIEGEGSDAGSDSYVNAVPVPAAAWLFGSAIVGLVATRRRKNQKMLTNLEQNDPIGS